MASSAVHTWTPNKSTDLLKTRKTRIESLNDRINEADYFLNTLDNNNPQNQDPHAKDAKKLLERMQKILSDLNEIKKTSNINEADIDREIAELPARSWLELSIAKVKVVNENVSIKMIHDEREEYIKRLEQELLKQRIDLEQVHKNENDNIVKISTLEDQIRILKSKAFGFDVAKKYEYYKDKQARPGQVAQIEDENLAYAMWEKENYDARKAPNRLDKLENSKQMWIGNSQGNIDKLVSDVDIANYNYQNSRGGLNNTNNNNNNNNTWRNNSSNNGNVYGNPGSNPSTNMRKISPFILNKN